MVVDVYPLCAVQAMMAYLVRQGNAPRRLVYASRWLPAFLHTSHGLAETYSLWQAFQGISQAIAIV